MNCFFFGRELLLFGFLHASMEHISKISCKEKQREEKITNTENMRGRKKQWSRVQSVQTDDWQSREKKCALLETSQCVNCSNVTFFFSRIINKYRSTKIYEFQVAKMFRTQNCGANWNHADRNYILPTEWK